jgi:hypothetical protein
MWVPKVASVLHSACFGWRLVLLDALIVRCNRWHREHNKQNSRPESIHSILALYRLWLFSPDYKRSRAYSLAVNQKRIRRNNLDFSKGKRLLA